MQPGFSICRSYLDTVKLLVERKTYSSYIAMPTLYKQAAFDPNWRDRLQNYLKDTWLRLQEKLKDALKIHDQGTTFNVLRKIIKRRKYGSKAHVTPQGQGYETFANYYGTLYASPEYQPRETEVILLDDQGLIEAIRTRATKIGRRKALSREMIPDDLLPD